MAHFPTLASRKPQRPCSSLRSGAPDVPFLFGPAIALSFVLALWPRYVFVNFGGVGLNPYTLGNLVGLPLCAILLFRRPQLYILWRNGMSRAILVVVALTLSIVWRFVCDALGETANASLAQTARDLVYIIAPFPIASVLFLSARARAALPIVLSACAAVISLMAFVEHMGSLSLVKASGLSRIAADASAVEDVTGWGGVRDGGFRAAGVFVHPILCGQYLAATAPISLALLWRRPIVVKTLALVSLAVMPLGVYATGTRSPFVVLVVSLVAAFAIALMRRRDPLELKAIMVMAALAVGAFAYAGTQTYLTDIIKGRTADEVESSQGRNLMIANGLAAIETSPLFGFGEGSSPSKAGVEVEGGMITIDNLYLSLLLDFGYVGAGLFLAVLAAILRLGMRTAGFASLPEIRAASIALTAAIVGLAVGQYVVSIDENLSFIYFAAGYFVAAGAQANAPAPIRRRGSGPMSCLKISERLCASK